MMNLKVITLAMGIGTALAANASSFNWFSYNSFDDTGYVYADSTTKLIDKSGALTIYLMDNDVKARTDLLSGIRKASDKSTYWDNLTKAGTGVLSSDSLIYDTTATYGNPDTTYNFYYAIFDSDRYELLVSDVVSGLSQVAATTDINFTEYAENTKNVYGTSEFSAAGWYSVPEPTSGLLLMLGMIGLGLRRKQRA